jgi:hypothetical protein
LIWNSKLRLHLENSIKQHFDHLLSSCFNCPDKPKEDVWLLIEKKKFMDIIPYPDIENEVRCGRYYLRVWVN